MKQLIGCLFILRCLFATAQQVETLVQLGHSDRVYCLDISNDAAVAITGSMDNAVKLWNVKNGSLIRTYRGHRGVVYDVQLSANAKNIFSCSWDDRRVLKWDALTGKILKQYANNNHPVSRMALSHQAKWLACLNDEGIILLNAEDFSVVKKIPIVKAKQLEFSEDDTKLIIADEVYKNEKILVYDLQSGKMLHSFSGIYSAESISIAKDKIVLCNYQEIKVFDLLSGKTIYTRAKDSVRISSACLNKAGSLLAVGLEQGSIFVCSLDGKLLKDGNGNEIKFEKKHSSCINQLQFSDDGKLVMTAGNDWSAKVFSVASGLVVRNFATKSEYIQSISMNGSGTALAFSSGHLQTGNHVGVWDLQKGKLLPLYTNDNPENYFRQVAFSARDKNIGAANNNGKIHWYSFPNNGNSGNISFGNAPITCVTLTPNGKNYIAGTKDGNLIYWRPDRNKSEQQEIAAKAGVASVAVSADGTKVIAGTFEGRLLEFHYESREQKQVIESHSLVTGYFDTSFVMSYGAVTGMSLDGNFAMRYASVMAVAYSPDNSLIAACGGSWINIFEAVSGKLVKRIVQNGAGFTSINFSNDGKTIGAGGADFEVRLFEVATGKLLKQFSGHQHEVKTVLFSKNQKYLISGSLDTQVKIWEISSGKELLSYIILSGGDDYVITNPMGYYFATKGAAGLLSFRIGNEVFPFEQFDLKYNRPDIILNDISKVAYTNEKSNPNIILIKSYHAAYLKRLKRLGFEEAQLGTNFHLPSITINAESIPLSTKQSSLSFQVKAEDSRYQLKSLNIWVNDVPFYGAKGKSLTGKNEWVDVQLPLSNEHNHISVSCTNDQGVESYREQFDLTYEGGTSNYKTIFIGIGISNYQDTAFNLKFAVKDVNDLATLMKSQNAQVYLLTDAMATRTNIIKLKEALMQTSVNDKVIISLSGHGLLSKDLDFYYATWDVNFQSPERNGLLYEDLEAILDGIPARNKLLLVDACHSGEIDKSENVNVAGGKPQEGISGFAARGSAILVDSNSIGLDNSFELMLDLFNDLSQSNGATVISAAGGKEYALESAAWNNGVFTYCVINALKNGAADLNKDKKVSVDELKQYVSTQVVLLTGGRQKPTSRKSNTLSNWHVN